MTKNSKYIAVWSVMVVLGVSFLWWWVFLSDGPAYFSKDWRRTGLVLGFSVIAGLVVFGVMRLPDALRQQVATVVFGTGAVLALVGCIYISYQLFQLRELWTANPSLRVISELGLSLCSVCFGLCCWFWNHFRKKSRHGLNNHKR